MPILSDAHLQTQILSLTEHLTADDTDNADFH